MHTACRLAYGKASIHFLAYCTRALAWYFPCRPQRNFSGVGFTNAAASCAAIGRERFGVEGGSIANAFSLACWFLLM